MNSLRVFLVDDLDLMTQTLALRLSAVPNLSVAGTSRADAPGLAAALSRSGADVVTVDVESRGISALKLLECVRLARPQVRVVVLTGSRTVPARGWGRPTHGSRSRVRSPRSSRSSAMGRIPLDMVERRSPVGSSA